MDKGIFNVDLLLISFLRCEIRVLEGCTGFFGIENHALIISPSDYQTSFFGRDTLLSKRLLPKHMYLLHLIRIVIFQLPVVFLL